MNAKPTTSSDRAKLLKRYRELLAQVRQHNRLYYELDNPEISDADYDHLYRQLVEFEKQHPGMRDPNSPTQRVGGEVLSQFSKFTHPEVMLSLDNSFDDDELQSFTARVAKGLDCNEQNLTWCLEPKVDGLSLELVYENGLLTTAATRGDGTTGEVVTHNARTLASIPLTLGDPANLVVRGEVYIEAPDLENVNAQRLHAGEQPFKNCRNAAAGSIRLLDSRVTAERPLRFLAWGVVDGERLAPGQFEVLHTLADLGFATHPDVEKLQGSKALVNATMVWHDQLHNPSNHIPFDGLVIKINDFEDQRRLGSTSKFPRWAIAHKFPAERVETVVNDIKVQVGRSGALTPVAILQSVSVSGTEVARASLHNEDQIRRLDVRVGDHVIIEKAGEVIPQVVEVVQAKRKANSQPYVMPSSCPECGTATIRLEDEAVRRCPNRLDCPAQRRESLIFFASRGALNIDGVGPALIDQLIEADLVQTPVDLFRLTIDQLTQLDRIGERSAHNIVQAIDHSRQTMNLDRLITALGIPLIGSVASRLLASTFKSLEQMIAAAHALVSTTDHKASPLYNELLAIDGIGDTMAASVVEFLAAQRTRDLLDDFLRLEINPHAEQGSTTATGPLSGTSFCVTGTLAEPRSTIHERITKLGGNIHTSVRKGTSYLVTGKDVGTSKLQKAEKYGTEIIDEGALASLLEEAGQQ